jgi:hypothetical protein
MKRSVVALLSAIGVAVAVMLALALWVRFGAAPREELPTLSGQRTTRSYDIEGFTGIETDGQWQVTLVRGDAWAVELAYPLELERLIDVHKEGETLVLDYSTQLIEWSDFGSRFEMSARVVMPALEQLDLSGASKLELSGFQGSELEIDTSGAVAIEGRDSRYDDLDLRMSGAGRTDLGGVTTTDAHIEVSGAQNVILRMAGGVLSGDVSGASHVEYFGTIASQDVDTSGIARIEHRE